MFSHGGFASSPFPTSISNSKGVSLISAWGTRVWYFPPLINLFPFLAPMGQAHQGKWLLERGMSVSGHRAEAVLGQRHQEAGEGSRAATAESIHGK